MLNSDIAAEIIKRGFAKERIRADAAEPKSTDDLRRLGIQRIMSSVKGRDSITNGIAAIQEYRIFVHPCCVNCVAELSSYCWKKDKNDNGLNEPEDRNNHLMDALRYGFYDVRFFHPADPSVRHRPADIEYENKAFSVTAEDMRGGWV